MTDREVSPSTSLSRGHLLAFTIAFLLALVSVPATAGAYVDRSEGDGDIGRAHLDGSGRSFTVDTAAPSLMITSGPDGLTDDSTPTFGFTAEAGATVDCSIDTGTASFGPCSDANTYTPAAPLEDGSYTFRVRATDAASNERIRTRDFTVDTAAPNTTIASGPQGPTTSSSATFAFTSSESGSTFECNLDQAGWSSCTSPTIYPVLSDGPHGFEVRATDTAGNTDASPASRPFAVDTAAPETTIDSGPQGLTMLVDPSFGFSSSEAGSSFECNLDEATWDPCDSPSSYDHLPDGPHSLKVRATDAAGNTDATPASRSFTVDTAAPQTAIDSGPQGPTGGTGAGFTFSSSESGSRFECNLDGAVWSSCVSPRSYAGLTLGPHTFEVRATDAAGNSDPTPASRAFTLTVAGNVRPDIQAPVLQITKKPKARIRTKRGRAKVSVAFGSEPGARFRCRLDRAAFKPCSSPFSVEAKSKSGQGLQHTITVRATDAAGNIGEPAVVAFKVVRRD